MSDAAFRPPPGDRSFVARLGCAPRQRQIAELLCAGSATKAAAWRLGPREKTIEYHRSPLFKELGVTNVVQLVLLLSELQPTEPDSES